MEERRKQFDDSGFVYGAEVRKGEGLEERKRWLERIGVSKRMIRVISSNIGTEIGWRIRLSSRRFCIRNSNERNETETYFTRTTARRCSRSETMNARGKSCILTKNCLGRFRSSLQVSLPVASARIEKLFRRREPCERIEYIYNSLQNDLVRNEKDCERREMEEKKTRRRKGKELE